MQSAQHYQQAAARAKTAQRTATVDAQCSELSAAWTSLVTASRHAILVERFAQQAAGMQNMAAQLSAQPGKAAQASLARARAIELMAISQRHREAAELRGDQGEKELAAAAGGAARGNGRAAPHRAANERPSAAAATSESSRSS